MNIIVRNMLQSDIEDLSRAFAAQGWLMPSSVFERHYLEALRRFSDVLVAEAAGEPAGFARIEWLDAGEECAYIPELREFVVLERYAGAGVAEALTAEAGKRIQAKTGDGEGNPLMAVYGEPALRPTFRRSFVLEGLLVSQDGRFIRARKPGSESGGMIISMCKTRRQGL